jgi:hypothetical protein
MTRLSAPGYDRFKLIVTLILIAILIWLLLSGGARTSTPLAASLPPATTVPPTVAAPATQTASPSPAPTATETAASTETLPPPTATPAPTATAILATGGKTEVASCQTSLPSRLSVGQTAEVLRNLNLRAEPSIGAAILGTSLPGRRVEILDGPVCTPQGDRAYLWWKVRRADGSEGWSAETALLEAAYFLNPVP